MVSNYLNRRTNTYRYVALYHLGRELLKCMFFRSVINYLNIPYTSQVFVGLSITLLKRMSTNEQRSTSQSVGRSALAILVWR